MAGFGGSVRLTGESEYKKALSQIQQSLKMVSAEMQNTAKLYDQGDKSMRELKNDSNMYKQTIDQQKTALQGLKDTLAKMSADYNKHVTAHNELIDQYNKETQKLEQIGRTLGTSSDEYKEQQKVVNDLSKEIDDSQKSLDQENRAMTDLRTKTANAESQLLKTTDAVDDLGEETEDTKKKTDDANKGWTVMKGVLADLTATAIKGAIKGLANLGKAFIGIGKNALDSYAEFEQLVGGVETLFGESADQVLKYSQDAYKNSGLTANEYMQTITSFSASLIQGLSGDTAKAVQISDMAISDMSDNANKMGTDMSAIQSAYQGFAKQNYTMLDNLKLGYGGTKTEMERLLKDAEKISGIKYDISNLGDVYEAIHVIQTEMGITGTTMEEASKTISGSTAMMKSAYGNLLTGIADDNADFDKLVGNFTESLMTMLSNILPRIKTIITGMGKVVGDLLGTLVPELIEMIPPLLMESLPILIDAINNMVNAVMEVMPQIVETVSTLIPQIVTGLVQMLPTMIEAGVQIILSLIQGFTQAIPQLMEMLPSILTDIVNTLTANLPLIISAGMELLMALVQGIVDAIPDLVDMIPTILDSIVTTIVDNLPMIVDAGIELLLALVDGILEAIPQLLEKLPDIIIKMVNALLEQIPKIIDAGVKLLVALVDNMPKIIDAGIKLIVALVQNIPAIISGIVKAIPQIIKGLIDAILSFLPKLAEVGLNLIKGLWNGIKNAGEWLWSKIKGLFNGVMSKIKSFFGIKSPSTLFRDEIGENLALGLGEGFEDTMQDVSKDMQNSIPTSFDVDASVNASGRGGATSNYYDMVNAFKEALSDMKIEMDDREMGKFVDKTVSSLVYA